MVEKITVNPESIRAYGNIIISKNASDYDKYESTVTKTTDTVYGAIETVFNMSPITYNMSFDSASYTTSTGSVDVQVTVLNNTVPVPNATVTIIGGGTGTGTTNIIGVATITVTDITESGTLTAVCGFSTATATVTYSQASYSLAFSQDTYTIPILGDVTVSCTLSEGGTPMSGETVTFSWEFLGGTSTVTATTNSSGVATHSFDSIDFEIFPATVTATYSGVTATCTIEEGGL